MRTAVEPVYDRLAHMQRRFRPANRPARGIFDAAPLADIILLLFFFFILQSPFVIQPGIRVDLPGAEFTDGATYGSMVVTLSQEGLVFFNDERATLDGLGEAFKQSSHDRPDASLLIEADGRVRHEVLMRIYNMAREAGIREVILASRIDDSR